MQQQSTYVHDLKEVCEKGAFPCRRDSMAVELTLPIFGKVRVTRCCAMRNRCGALFVQQCSTGHELPLHVISRQTDLVAASCLSAMHIALSIGGRENEVIAEKNCSIDSRGVSL